MGVSSVGWDPLKMSHIGRSPGVAQSIMLSNSSHHLVSKTWEVPGELQVLGKEWRPGDSGSKSSKAVRSSSNVQHESTQQRGRLSQQIWAIFLSCPFDLGSYQKVPPTPSHINYSNQCFPFLFLIVYLTLIINNYCSTKSKPLFIIILFICKMNNKNTETKTGVQP